MGRSWRRHSRYEPQRRRPGFFDPPGTAGHCGRRLCAALLHSGDSGCGQWPGLSRFGERHIYAEAEDWPSHNWYAAHRRANPTNGLPATKWIFLSWDQEIVLDQLVINERINSSDNDTPARIYSQLRAWPEFRRLFGDRIQKHLF